MLLAVVPVALASAWLGSAPRNTFFSIVARRAVELPPAVGIFSLVAFGVLFGPLGLLLGYPLAVVISVAVRRLYVHGALGEPLESDDQASQASEPS